MHIGMVPQKLNVLTVAFPYIIDAVSVVVGQAALMMRVKQTFFLAHLAEICECELFIALRQKQPLGVENVLNMSQAAAQAPTDIHSVVK